MKANFRRIFSVLLAVMLIITQCGMLSAEEAVASEGGWLDIVELKTEYCYREPFSAKLRYCAPDGTVHDDIPAFECEVSGFNSLAELPEEQEVTIQYMDASVTCTVQAGYNRQDMGKYNWGFNNATGELVICANGSIDAQSPWLDYAADIRTITIVSDTYAGISAGTFKQCGNVETINIEGGIRTIPSYTFHECKNVKNIFLPSTLNNLVENSFYIDTRNDVNVFYFGGQENWDVNVPNGYEVFKDAHLYTDCDKNAYFNIQHEYQLNEDFYCELRMTEFYDLDISREFLTVQGFDSSVPGRQMVTVSFGPFSETTVVEVAGHDEPESVIENVYFENAKHEYYFGESFYAEIYATVDGVERRVDLEECEIEGFDSTCEGNQQVILRYGGYEFVFEVYVHNPDEAVPYDVVFENVKLEYNHGEAFYFEVYKCIGDEKIPVAMEECIVEGYDCYAEGHQIVTVQYEGYMAEFEVYVNPQNTDEIFEYSFDGATLTVIYAGDVLDRNKMEPIYAEIGDLLQVTQIKIVGEFDTIESGTFCDFTELETVIIDANVRNISPDAFMNINMIRLLWLPATLEYIDAHAFSGTSVETLLYGGSQEQFDSSGMMHDLIQNSGMPIVYYNCASAGSYVIANVKTQYEYGEEFQAEVYRIMNGTLRSVSSSNLEITNFDSSISGEQTVSVTYNGYTVDYTVTVGQTNEPEPEPEVTYTVQFENVKPEYEYGEDFYVEVWLYYSDGRTEIVDDYVVEGFDSFSPGIQAVTVYWGNYCETFDIMVVSASDINEILNKINSANGYQEYMEIIEEYKDVIFEDESVYIDFQELTSEREAVLRRVYNSAPFKTLDDFVNELHNAIDNEKNSSVSPGVGGGGSDADGAVISLSGSEGLPGETVEITLNINNNTGFANLGFEIGYDASVLTLLSVNENADVDAIFTAAESIGANPYNVSWDSTSDITFNGTLATFTFKIADDAPAGEYPIWVDFYRGRNGDYIDGEDVNYNSEEEPLNLIYECGTVNIYDHIPGDINGDGVVNNKDATYLLRYLSGWNIEDINQLALDTTGDSKINSKDGTRLLRHLANWDVDIY